MGSGREGGGEAGGHGCRSCGEGVHPLRVLLVFFRRYRLSVVILVDRKELPMYRNDLWTDRSALPTYLRDLSYRHVLLVYRQIVVTHRQIEMIHPQILVIFRQTVVNYRQVVGTCRQIVGIYGQIAIV